MLPIKLRVSLLVAALLCCEIAASPVSAQQGIFSNYTYIVDVATEDTVLVDSLSRAVPAYAVQSVHYRFTDTVLAGTTLYWEVLVEPARGVVSGYSIVDSLVVSSFSPPSGSTYLTWNITDQAIGVGRRFRLRKSTTADSLVAIYNGYSELK